MFPATPLPQEISDVHNGMSKEKGGMIAKSFGGGMPLDKPGKPKYNRIQFKLEKVRLPSDDGSVNVGTRPLRELTTFAICESIGMMDEPPILDGKASLGKIA